MSAQPSAESWPPNLGGARTSSLVLPLAGFDAARTRLGEVTTRLQIDLLEANVELSAALWFARLAVEQIRMREWPGGQPKFDSDMKKAGHDRLLAGFRWARNQAGHALASAAAHDPGLFPSPDLFPGEDVFPGAPRWLWASRADLPPAKPDHFGEQGYDSVLAGQELRVPLEAMSVWLRGVDADFPEAPATG